MTMKTRDLTFDRQNPRLPEYDLGPHASEEDIVRILWEAMDVRELVMSIAASGFFPHEPVIVVKEDEKNVVIEGNRRLAAVRILLDPQLAKSLDFRAPSLSLKERANLDDLPAVVLDTREETWQQLGFKHVNGPAKWSSYAKSRYIAKVHRNFNVPLEQIAEQIGDTHNTVQRLFRGLMVIEQAEKFGVFERTDRYRKHFSFSHLYTGITYPHIRAHIGLQSAEEDQQEPVPKDKQEELGELCRWLYGSRQDGIQPIVQSQNPDLSSLEKVVGNTEALGALRAGRGLELALEAGRPPTAVFRESLLASKRELEQARASLTTGFDGSQDLLRIANEVANLADDLHAEMLRKSQPRQRREKENN